MARKRFTTMLIQDDDTAGCGIELPFNPKDVFGKVRAPVKTTINGFTFRTTTFSMGGVFFIPVNKQNRVGAKVAAGDKITVQVETDDAPRVIDAPADLVKALRAARVLSAWKKLSYTHQKEHVQAIEEAKKPETRRRRIAKAVEALGV